MPGSVIPCGMRPDRGPPYPAVLPQPSRPDRTREAPDGACGTLDMMRQRGAVSALWRKSCAL